FDNRGGVNVAAGANFISGVATTTPDDAWFDLLGPDSYVEVGAGSVLAGDIFTRAGTNVDVSGASQLTTTGRIIGEGDLTVSATDEPGLVADGTVDVTDLDAVQGSLVVRGATSAGTLTIVDGGVEVDAAGSLTADALHQTGGVLQADGEVVVSGNATFDDGVLVGSDGATDVIRVDGAVTASGTLPIQDVTFRAGSLSFVAENGQQAGVELLGDRAHLDVSGAMTTAIATLINDSTGTAASFHAGIVSVTADTLTIDAPWTVDTDDSVTVAADATLETRSDFVQRGSFIVDGEMLVSAGGEIEHDIELGADASIGVAQSSWVTLVGGATIGGIEAEVGNEGLIDGTGGLVGTVYNDGVIATDGTIDVLGLFEQGANGTIAIEVNGDHHGTIAVTENATLAGTLEIALADNGALPTEAFDALTANGAIEGTFTTVDGLQECADLTYAAHAVTIVPQPCVAIAAAQATEGTERIDFAVSLTEPAAHPVVVHYSLLPGTADITDYVDAEPGASITIPAGETTGTITVTVVDDDDEEQDESFTVGISADGADLANAEATGTIRDDDTPLDLEYRSIPMIDFVQYISGIGTDYVVGIASPDADTNLGWAYRISDGGFAGTKGNFQPYAINANDQAVGDCGADSCMRDHGVDTILSPSTSVGVTAISDAGEIVGYQYTGHNLDKVPGRWATATAGFEAFTALGAPDEMAVDVSEDGTIVGTSKFGANETHGWIRTPDGTITDIGTILGMPIVHVAGVSDDGVVAGAVMSGEPNTPTHGFTWTAAGGMVDLGPFSFVLDINGNGDMVGHINGSATLWRGDRVFDLNHALGFGNGVGPSLALGEAINDQGSIVVTGWSGASPVTAVLVPPNAGCQVCLDAHVYEAEFPRPDYLIDAGDEIVEGNPAELFAEVTNHDDTTRTVSITFVGPDGQPMDEPRSLTLAPDQKDHTYVPFETDGLAWDNGADAGPIEVKIEMRSADGQLMSSTPFSIRVIPRPVVNVHGMNSDASTWGAYPAFVSNAHVGWKAFAVDTMDTKPWLPNSVAENAALLGDYIDGIQRQENAWQVDLVAHSMGGLISRYYIQNLMPDNSGHRPARSLVMLGTPNAGSPCADLFRVPMTAELRTDVMRQFNQSITDHRGVPFSLAAGDPMSFTCTKPGPGDMVVPLDSALYGVEDTAVYPILHTDMTFSAQLFDEFVRPRLSGVTAPAAPAGLVPAVTSRASSLAASAAVDPQPQLLASTHDQLAPGETGSYGVQVPEGVAVLGVSALGAASIEVELVKSGNVIATTGTDPAYGIDFRTLSTSDPASGSWTIRLTNHGTTDVDVPSVVWISGSPTSLEVHAEQIGITGKVLVTATVTGTPPSSPSSYMMATATDHSGREDLIGDLRDNGVAPDAVAGDGVYSGLMTGLVPGPVVIEVSTDNPNFNRIVSTGLVVKIGTDGPGNDPPVASGATVTVPTGMTSRIDLEAADPEGQPLTFDIVTLPAHGQLGGEGPFYDYLPANGYQGPDSFVYRVHDGQVWSAPATVNITVGKAVTTLTYQAPVPRVATTGLPMHVVLRVEGPRLEAVDGGSATFEFGTHTVESTVNNGRLEADVPVDVAAGTHDLVVTFDGNDGYQAATFTTTIDVWEGSAPAPALEPLNGEAGYPARLQGRANDPDVDAVRYQFDFTDDGVFDAEVGPNEGRLTWADHTYPDAFDGQARMRVTDAAGHVVEAVAPVHIAPHRELGALRRILVDGEPVEAVDVSDDGRLLLYRVTDNEGEFSMPTPLGVLDLQTGAHEIVSIRPDGQREDFPLGGVLSADGRTVAFSTLDYVNGFQAMQVLVRDLDTGVSTLASLNNAGQKADRGGEALGVTNGGTKVLFQSASRNMNDFDTWKCGTKDVTEEPCYQLYMRDLTTSTTTLVTERVGTDVADVLSGAGMSPDGRYVAYGSWGKLWFVDLETGARSELASTTHAGIAHDVNVSDGGRYVTFSSEAPDLVPGDTNGFVDVFRLDRQTGTFALVSATSSGTVGSRGAQGAFADRCGVRTVFWSNSPDLVGGDTNELDDLFLRDGSTTRRISVEARDGIEADGGTSLEGVLSGNGRFAFFTSGATNLVPGDVEGYTDTFVLDLGSTTSCDDSPTPPVNHPPTASPLTVSTDEDLAVAVELHGDDPDGDELSFEIVAGPAHGTVTGEGAERSYAPAPGWSGIDTFTYTASDGSATSEPATVTVTVHDVDHAPTA
ncbi:MAG: Ig-like domain-containing protein, partial [Ilumatobacteraceae bacterium]